MKHKTLAVFAAVLVSGGMGFLCARGVPALALDEAKSALIDKDFELALKTHFEKRFFNRINATDEQREKISALLTDRMNQSRPERESLREGAVDLCHLLSDGSDSVITEKARALQEKHDKLLQDRVQTLLKVRAILTPEQRKLMSDRLSILLSGGAGKRLLTRAAES